MKKNNGFTLIELLAVIVILAVIALIATPIIMNVIQDSKEGAAKDAMYGYVKAVELAAMNQVSATTAAPSGENFVTVDGNIYEGSIKKLTIAFKGTKPKDNTGVIKMATGNVTYAKLEFDGIIVTYDGKKAEIVSSGVSTPTASPTPTNPVYSVGKEVYYNPETNTKCSASEAVSTTGTKTGCMKWNVIVKQDTSSKATIDIMLDHNTTATVAWGYDMMDATEALNNDTATWKAGINPRIIDGQEIANIAGKSWSGSDSSGISFSEITWLYQNTVSFSNGVPNGYWTSSPSIKYGHAWYVIYDGTLDDYDNADTAAAYGIRPVVTIQKSVLS